MADAPKGTHVYQAPQGGVSRIIIERSKDLADPTNIKEVAAHYAPIVKEAMAFRREQGQGLGISEEKALHPATSLVDNFVNNELGGNLGVMVRDAVRTSTHHQFEAQREKGLSGGVVLNFNNIAAKNGDMMACTVAIDGAALKTQKSVLESLGSEQIVLASTGYNQDHISGGEKVDIRKHPGVKINCAKGP